MVAAPPQEPPDLKACLRYSAGLHLAAALLGLGLLRGPASRGQSVYTIDFVGPSGGVIQTPGGGGGGGKAAETPAPRPAPPPKPAPLREAPEFGTGRRKPGAPLPKPSLLSGTDARAKPAPAPEAPASRPAAEEGGGGSGPAGEAGVATDMPDFPYPWYITQVRTALWSQWSGRMPPRPGEAVAVFSIRPNGEVVDLRVEESSGDAAFDLAALGAVQDSAPFPPLPRGFGEPFLKVHVTLRSGGQ